MPNNVIGLSFKQHSYTQTFTLLLFCFIYVLPMHSLNLLWVIFTVHTKVLLFRVQPLPFPNITVRFPCQRFLGDYSGALVWKLRKCVISVNVGGERSSVCGGMPKGRNEWVAEMYIKKSSVVLRDKHTLCSHSSFRAKSRLEKEPKQDLSNHLSSSRALWTEY